MRRAARLAEGWIWSGAVRPGAEAQALIDGAGALVADGGCDPAAFGIESRLVLSQLAPEQWAAEVSAWRGMRGVTHLCVDTMRLGLTKPEQHVETLRRLKDIALG